MCSLALACLFDHAKGLICCGSEDLIHFSSCLMITFNQKDYHPKDSMVVIENTAKHKLFHVCI